MEPRGRTVGRRPDGPCPPSVGDGRLCLAAGHRAAHAAGDAGIDRSGVDDGTVGQIRPPVIGFLRPGTVGAPGAQAERGPKGLGVGLLGTPRMVRPGSSENEMTGYSRGRQRRGMVADKLLAGRRRKERGPSPTWSGLARTAAKLPANASVSRRSTRRSFGTVNASPRGGSVPGGERVPGLE